MKRGQTIVAARERIQSESERMLARKKAQRKKIFTVVALGLMLVILILLAVMMAQSWLKQSDQAVAVPSYEPTVPIVDENGLEQIPERVREYAGRVERDLAELGYVLERVTLPSGKSRELYLHLAGRETYVKVSLDRGTAVTAEDVDRGLRYLDAQGLVPGYLDVRVERRAYYK